MAESRVYPVAHEVGAQDGEQVRVLAAVIQQTDRFLVCLRPAHKRHGGFWEFPGGKLELGEGLFQAATRELREELAVEVASVSEPIFRAQDPGSQFVIEFVKVVVVGAPESREHDEIRWVTAGELKDLRLAPCDRAFSFTLSCSDP
jgi:mutator protein MutT